jgi:two-component system chemotaxis sensor kinase CheA
MTDLSLLEDFIPEAQEHLEEFETNLLRLEANPGDRAVLDNIFRCTHTIKGSAEYLGLPKIAALAHRLENLLELIRHGEATPDKKMVDVFFASRDRLASLVNELQAHQNESSPIQDLLDKIDRFSGLAKNPPKEPDSGDDFLGIGDDLPGASGLKQQADELFDGEPDVLGHLDESVGADDPPAAQGGVMGLGSFDMGTQKANNDMKKKDLGLPDDSKKNLSFASPDDSAQVKDSIGASAIARLDADESFEEEYDQELYGIFVDHLKENLELLSAKASGLSSSQEGVGLLESLVEVVAGLRQSASYMDYRALTAFYDSWVGQMREVQNRIKQGRKESFAFMGDFVSQLMVRFSLVEEKVKEPPQKEPAVKTVEAKPAARVQDSAPAAAPPKNQQPDKEGSQGLFDELDAVFDSHAAPAAEQPLDVDPFSDDMDELLVTGKAAKAELPPKTPETKPSASVSEFDPAPPDKILEPAQKAPPASFSQDAPKEAAPKEAVPEKPAAAPQPLPSQAPVEAPKAKEPDATLPPAGPALPQDAQTQEPASALQFDASPADRVVKQSLRVDSAKIDILMNQVGELVVSRASYGQLFNDMRLFQQELASTDLDPRMLKTARDLTFRISEATTALGRVANELQEGVMKVRMLPIAQLFNRYPRLVRDLAQGTGKLVHLEIRGEETELDKMVIEEIADPLIHIIRNAVDHGLETAAQRKAAGKHPEGTLRLESYHESNHVVVEIIDDGKGIDVAKVGRLALEKGLLTSEELERMRPKEVLSIIMMPGFSTSEQVTTTSGRGVGMDVVKKNIEKLNGTVEVDSKLGAGTRVRIKIPLTLAIIQALLVRVGASVYTIPLAVVEKTLRVMEKDITTIEGVEVIQLREGVLSLLRLTSEFKARSSSQDPDRVYVVVVNTGMRQVGLVVDSLIGQEEVVIKPLVDYLQEQSGFSGATILGDGRVSLILDAYELVNLCMQRQTTRRDTDATWEIQKDLLPGKSFNASNGSKPTLH